MDYGSLVYNLLTNVFWSITPALPGGLPATRLPVGVPEVIPDRTFITRELIASDGDFGSELDHFNQFIRQARRFHTMYGLAPQTVNSIEDILHHFRNLPTPLGRIRFVTHGSSAFMFVPIFNGGLWDVGTDPKTLIALQKSDEDGLRFLFTAKPALPSPVLIDGVSQMVSGIQSHNSAIVTPLGTPPFTLEVQKFLQVVNDFYQVRNGTIVVGSPPPSGTFPPEPIPPFKALIPEQERILEASLTIIEIAVRKRVLQVGGTTITTGQLNDFKTAVLSATPVQLEFMGSSLALSPTVIADVATAMNATPRVEADIRAAIVAQRQPLFRDYLTDFLRAMQLFHPNVFSIGGVDHDETTIGANPDLEAFCYACLDLHFLKNGPLFIGPTPVTPPQRTTLRNAVFAISDKIREHILSTAPTIKNDELKLLRSTMEALSLRRSAITGGPMKFPPTVFRELNAANRAMNDNFRAKLEHFRGLMRPGDATKLDIRGCLVGATPSFLDPVLRDFLGGVNKPTISAPEFFQSFPAAMTMDFNATIFTSIDALVSGGVPNRNISGADVTNSADAWRTLIDFDPHYDFITDLFTAGGSKRTFATLAWRVFRVGTSTTGIPVLRMQARRIDDLVSLNLRKIIERFAVIFQVRAPNDAALARLNKLQPHLVTFKAKADALAAGPTNAELSLLFTALTKLANDIGNAALAPVDASLPEIATSVINIGNRLDQLLDLDLDPFLAAIHGRIVEPNAKINYFYNIGLPLLLQSSATPATFTLSVRVLSTADATETQETIAGAFRSWMRIQWTGTAEQATEMNAIIRRVPLGNDPERTAASQVSMLTRDDPTKKPNSPTGIAPMQAFHDHIITRP